MEYKNIPRTQLSVSSICLGGSEFGTSIRSREAMELMDCFFELGGNFIDTANIYGKWSPEGRSASEEVIGRWMKEKKNRDSLVLTTKGAHPHLETMNIQRLSSEEIKADLEESLKNLQADCIDLYWLHRDDRKRSIEEIIDGLEALVKEGKIRYYACSNWTAARMESAYEYAMKTNAAGFVADQMMWSLAKPNPEAMFDQNMVAMNEDLKKFHEKTLTAAIPYSSQANGYFSFLDQMEQKAPPQEVMDKYDNPVNRKRYQRIREFSRKTGASIPAVIIAYLLHQPFTVIPVAGFDTKELMLGLFKEMDIRISADDVKYLDFSDAPDEGEA